MCAMAALPVMVAGQAIQNQVVVESFSLHPRRTSLRRGGTECMNKECQCSPWNAKVHIDSSGPDSKCREEHYHLFRLTMYQVWVCLGLETAVFLSLGSEYVAIRDAGDSGCVVSS